MSTRCPACSRDNFTVTGLSQHLAKSRNPHCRALYHQSRSQLEIHANGPQFEPDESTWPDLDPDEGDGEDEPEVEFQRAQEQSGGSDVDDDVDDEGWNFEPEWEPPVEEQDEHDRMDAIEDLADDDEAFREDHQDIQARAQGQHGCVVVPYPDPRAGQKITNCRAANMEYGAHLANAEENLYHPFASKMDWEVARWAKLRGVSSTALSDLLAIEGVSWMPFIPKVYVINSEQF